MEKNILHNFGSRNNCFCERRLIFRTPEVASKAVAERLKAIDLITKLFNIEKKDPRTGPNTHVGWDNPDTVVGADNPYQLAFLKIAENFPDGDVAAIETKPGEKVVVQIKGKPDFVIEGDAFLALEWPGVSTKLTTVFAGKLNSDEIVAVLGKGVSEFDDVYNHYLMHLPGNPQPNALDKAAKAVKEFLAAPKKKAAVLTKSKRAQAKTKTKIETFKMKGDIEEAKKKALDQMTENLKHWKISVRRRNLKINAELWDPSNEAGLKKIKEEWIKLGIYVSNPFYKTVFSEMKKSYQPPVTIGAHVLDASEKELYKNPAANKEKIQSLDPDYYSSYSFFESIKKIVVDQDNMQVGTEEKLQKSHEDPIFSKVGKGISANVANFQEAIRNRDWSTAAVYVVGIYAMYKAYKGMEGKKKDTVRKMALWGAALYAGNMFAEKAGVDILKKLGFRKDGHEVEDTPLVALARLNIPGAKSLDYGIFLSVANFNLKSLYDIYETTNDPKIQWMDPAQFPAGPFDKFSGMNPAIDLQGSHLSAKQKEYKRVGKELYKLVQAMEIAYKKTMGKNSDKTFAQALRDGTLQASTVLDFMTAIKGEYQLGEEEERKLGGLGTYEKMFARFDEVFEGKNMAFYLEPGHIKAGVHDGTIKDLPVVFVRGKNGYYVFTKKDYVTAGDIPPIGKAIATIPFTGNANAEVNKLDKKINNTMMGLLDIFTKSANGAAALSKPMYHPDGYWYAELQMNRGKLLNGKPKPVSVRIKVGREDGSSLELINETDNEVLVSVNDVMNKNALFGNLVLAELVSQDASEDATDFRALGWLYRAKLLRFEDSSAGDNKFNLKIDRIDFPIEVTFVNGKYVIYKEIEKKLLEHPNFKSLMAEAVVKNSRFADSIKQLRTLVENTDESYFIHFFQNIPSWFKDATWHHPLRGVKASQFTGSVPKYYTLALINSQQDLLSSKLMSKIHGATALGDIPGSINAVLPGAAKKLDAVSSILSSTNFSNQQKGDEWSMVDFEYNIINRLTEVGIASKTYHSWYQQFVDQVTITVGGKSDFSTKDARFAGKLAGLWAHYTADIDEVDLDGVNLAVIPSDPKKRAQYDIFKKKTAYAEYVAKRIFDQVGVRLKPGTVLEPSKALNIASWDEFQKDPSLFSVRYEFIDKTPPMKGIDDYVTIDEFLNTWTGNLAKRKKRLKEEGKELVMPRRTVSLDFKNVPEEVGKYAINFIDKNVVNPANGRDNIGLPENVTEIEREFYIRLDSILKDFEKKFGRHFSKNGIKLFRALRNAYKPAYTWDLGTGESPADISNIKLEYGHLDEHSKFKNTNPKSQKIEENIEALFKAKRGGKTVTKNDQDIFIDNQVRSIIEHKLKDRWNLYFDEKSIIDEAGKWLTEMFKRAKYAIF